MAIHQSIKSQRPYEQVRFSAVSGRPDATFRRVVAKLGALSRYGGYHLKVGITNRPVRRWSQAYRRHGWVRMEVVYTSSSHRHVCLLERWLISRFQDGLTSSLGYYWNAVGGGGGRKPVRGPYFLYVVTAPKYARID